MLPKSVLVSLMGLTAVSEAATVRRPFENIMARRANNALNTRQFGGGGGFGNGGGFGGGGFGNGGGFGGGNNGGDNGGNNGGNDDNNNDNNNNNGGNNNNNNNNQCLDPEVIATGSAQDGTADSDDPAEAPSET